LPQPDGGIRLAGRRLAARFGWWGGMKFEGPRRVLAALALLPLLAGVALASRSVTEPRPLRSHETRTELVRTNERVGVP